MQKISSLIKLYIDDNNITYKAADDIAAAISCNHYLQEFNIGRNHLGSVGAIKIAKGLQSISTLTKLCIHGNNIPSFTVDDIAYSISHNTQMEELDVSWNNFQAVGIMKIAKCLQHICTLKKLNVSCNNITDEAADDIADVIMCNTQMEELDVSRNYLQTMGVRKITKSLQNVYTLKKLNICYNSITNDAADDIAIVIMCNTQMEELDVSGTDLQTTGIMKIAKSLLHSCALKKLYINKNNITDKAANDITDVIKCNPHLQEFDISINNLQVPGITRIARGLQNISKLKKVYINNNNITDEAAGVIADVILCNSNLVEFDIGASNLQALGAKKIAKALQKISSLKKLYISNNNITDIVADDIVAIISCNKIQELDVSKNNLKAAGIIKLAQALQIISTLTSLYINNNKVTDEAADDIAAAISCNPRLEEFDIGENRIQDKGAIRLAKSLQQISTLRKLFIDHNIITDEAADDFVAVIHHNSHLKEFRINGNKLQNVSTLKAACFAHRNLTKYKLF